MLVMAPILFVGCFSKKTASIKPVIQEKKIANLESNKTISKEEKLLASAIFGGEISLTEKESTAEKKAYTHEADTHTETLTTQTLNFDETWKDSAKEEKILETARKFLGVKYIWAANGPTAFDCSGFTKYVFKKNGISLPRHSGHQANIGKKIKFKDLEKGDLVFFDTSKKFKRQVNHVGIFIGDNKFIHASSAKKKVIITSFSKKKFYKNKFLYARRIVNANPSFALNTNLDKEKATN